MYRSVNRNPTPINLNHAKRGNDFRFERSSREGNVRKQLSEREGGAGWMDADKTRNENVEGKRNLGERGAVVDLFVGSSAMAVVCRI